MRRGNPNPKTEHLKATQIKPGEVRNPKGSNNRQRLTTALLKLFDEGNLDDEFMRAGLKAALKGDFNFWRHIFERIEGKVADRLITSSESDAQDERDFLKHAQPTKTAKFKGKKPKGKKADPKRGAEDDS